MSTKLSQKNGSKANGSIIQKSNTGAAGNKGISGSWRCCFIRYRRLKFSPVTFLRQLGGKVAKGLHEVSMKIRPSHKVSSSSTGRSKPLVTTVDSHRTAAIEDCIEFINFSASLPRSNSVSSNLHN